MQKINSQEELKAVLKTHADKLPGLIPKCTNEEQTKISLINPYLEFLGWDVRNPDIVRLEYLADFDRKNSERVDYAILKEGKVLILIEAKPVGTTLPSEAPPQLLRYFQAENARYAIMTNGVVWQWYQQDPDGNPGQLAAKPFLVHHATHVSDQEIPWLWSINPDRFDERALRHKAWQSDTHTRIRKWFEQNLQEPEEDFIKFLIKKTKSCKAATSSAIKDMKEPVRNALNQTIQSRIRDRINLSLNQERPESEGIQDRDTPPAPAAAPETPKPEPLKNPYILDWVPITEWKRFQPQRVPGQSGPKVRMTIRLPDSTDRECVGWSHLVRAVIDWMDSRVGPTSLPVNRLIHIPGSTMTFANTEPRHHTGRKILRIHHAKNLGMYFELNLNTENLIPSVIALLERFRMDPQQVMIRSNRRESK